MDCERARRLLVTGESYPTCIQIAGYDSRAKKLYLNIVRKTIRTIPENKKPKFDYFVEVFGGVGVALGTKGSYTSLEKVTEAVNTNTATVTNLDVLLPTGLTAAYHVVVTVPSARH